MVLGNRFVRRVTTEVNTVGAASLMKAANTYFQGWALPVSLSFLRFEREKERSVVAHHCCLH